MPPVGSNIARAQSLLTSREGSIVTVSAFEEPLSASAWPGLSIFEFYRCPGADAEISRRNESARDGYECSVFAEE